MEVTRAWGVLLEAVDDDGLLRKMVAAGSPSGAQDTIEQWHAPKSACFGEIWQGIYRAIRMRQGEEPLEYLARIDDAVAMLALLVPVSDADVNYHILSHLSSDYGIETKYSNGSWGRRRQRAALAEDGGSGNAGQEEEEEEETSSARGEGQRQLGNTLRNNETRRGGGRDEEYVYSGGSNGNWHQAQRFSNEGGGGPGSGSGCEDGDSRSCSRGRDRPRNKKGGSRGGPGRDAPLTGEEGGGFFFWPQQLQHPDFYTSHLRQGSAEAVHPSSYACPSRCYRCAGIGHVRAECMAVITLAHGATPSAAAACVQYGQGNNNSNTNSNSNGNSNSNNSHNNNSLNINNSKNNRNSNNYSNSSNNNRN